MRITYLHQYFNTPEMVGGTRSYEMARRLVAAGHTVNMVTAWREPSNRTDWFVTTEAGITVHWLPDRYSNHMGYARRMAAFARFAWAAARRAAALPADVVLATSTPLTIALPGVYAARRRKAPMVFEVRDVWPAVPIAMGVLSNPMLVMLSRMLERWAYRHAAAIIALAPGMKDAVCQHGIERDRVHVIPNGCDFDIFADPAIERMTLAGGGAGRSVLYMGAMGVANGVEYIPRLAAALSRQSGSQPVHFYLAGDGSRRASAEALAAELGVLDRTVHFVGPLPKRDVARWLSTVDATVMTYDGPEVVYRDSVSNKFFDSLAAGKPVFANFAGFSTQSAQEAGAGFILSRDPAEAAAALASILTDPRALARAGAAASTLAHARFSREHQAAELERVLAGAARQAPS